MIYQLRNRHFRIWIAIGILLPIGFIAALTAIPKELFGEVISHQRPVEATVKKLSEDDMVIISTLREADNPGLEITLKKPLTVPGANVYLAEDQSEDINLAQLLGQIDSKNSYYFSIDQEITQGQYLLFVDPINKVLFHKVVF